MMRWQELGDDVGAFRQKGLGAGPVVPMRPPHYEIPQLRGEVDDLRQDIAKFVSSFKNVADKFEANETELRRLLLDRDADRTKIEELENTINELLGQNVSKDEFEAVQLRRMQSREARLQAVAQVSQQLDALQLAREEMLEQMRDFQEQQSARDQELERVQKVVEDVQESKTELVQVKADKEHVEEVDRQLRQLKEKVQKTKSSVEAQTAREAEMTIQLSESVWDAALFCFSSDTDIDLVGGKRMHVFLFFSFVLTFFLKASIAWVMIMNSSFYQPSIDMTPVAARKWRERSGHNLEFIDPITKDSLTKRVCGEDGGDTSVPYSTHQRLMVEEIDQYLAPWGSSGLCDGDVLRYSVMLIWFLIVVEEFQKAYNFWWAARSLYRRGHRGLVKRDGQMDWEQETFQFESINIRQLMCVSVVTITRWAFAGILAFQGMGWLARTTSITDLILNAAALSFIFEIDTYTYHVAVPTRLRCIMSKVEPLPVKRCSDSFGSDTWGAPISVAMSMLFVFIIIYTLFDSRSQIEKVRNELCDGFQDFAVGILDGTLRAVSVNISAKALESDIMYSQAVREIVMDPDAIKRYKIV